MPNVAAFISYVLVANLSPGPNAVLSMANAGKYGLRKSLRFNAGITVGIFFVMLLCSLFSLTIAKLFPAVQSAMIWIGGAYILWLAWKTLTGKSMGDGDEARRPDRLFLQGALLQLVNPNSILYGITCFSTFIVPYYNSAKITLLFAAGLALTAFFCTAAWTLFGSIFRKFVLKHEKLVNAVLAILLVYCAVSLFL